jgi:prepilin-type N-terminal cleavage/methylation domain-containing protein
MRRAFTLVELLVVVTIAPLLMVVISHVYVTFIRDIPRMTRALQVNTTVLDALRQIRRDVDGAVGLPEQFESCHADARTLLIEQAGGVVCYQIENGRIVRTRLSGSVSEDRGRKTKDGIAAHPQSAIRNPQSPERVWRVPEAVIAWRPWVRDGRAYAVEIHSHVMQQVEGFMREKLANSQVFFLPVQKQEGETE